MNQSSYTGPILQLAAKALFREVQPDAYGREWGTRPLKNLSLAIIAVLNRHPDKLGDLIAAGPPYSATVRSLLTGDLTDDERKAREAVWYDYTTAKFSKSHAHLNQPVHADKPDADRSSPYSLAELALMDDLTGGILRTYMHLDPARKREHATLEQVVKSLVQLYYQDFDLRGIGFDIYEFRDYLRDMPTSERRDFLAKHFDSKYLV